VSSLVTSENIISTLDSQAVSQLFSYFKQHKQGQTRLAEAVKEWKRLLNDQLSTDDYLQLLTQHALCASFVPQVSIEIAQKIQQSPVFQHFERSIAFVSIPSELAEITQRALSAWSDMLKKAKGANRKKIMFEALEDIFLYFVENHSFESPSLEWQSAVAQYALDWAVTLHGKTFTSIETETFLPTFSEKLIQLAENEKIKISTFYNTNSLPLYYASYVTFPEINILLVNSFKYSKLVNVEQGTLFQRLSPLEDILHKENTRKVALIFGEYSEEWLQWAVKRLADNGLAVAFSSENIIDYRSEYQNLPFEEVRCIKTEEKSVVFFKKAASNEVQSVKNLLGIAQKEGKKSYKAFDELEFQVVEEQKLAYQTSNLQNFELWKNDGLGIFKIKMKGIEIENENLFISENKETIEKNVQQFIQEYQEALQKSKSLFESIDFQAFSFKWTKELKELLLQGVNLTFRPEKIISLIQKPFQSTFFYAESLLQEGGDNYFEKVLGTDFQQPNVFIFYSNGELWASNQLLHHKFSKEVNIFPKFIYNAHNQSTININSSTFEAFKSYYLPKFQAEKEHLLASSPVGAANMKELVEGLVKLSKNLPVLHKYTLKIFNLLPRKAEGNLNTEKALEIFKIVQEYEAKILALSKGAKERQKQYNQLKESLLQIKSALEDTIRIEEIAKQKTDFINVENIFNYVFGVLSAKRQLEEEVFITFEDDFWGIAEQGKVELEKILSPEKLEKYTVEVIENEDITDEIKPKFRTNKTSGTLTIDTKTTLKGIPSTAWDKKINGKPILIWWIETQKKMYHPENKSVLIENFSRLVSSLKAKDNLVTEE
jgi:hypothetical protein